MTNVHPATEMPTTLLSGRDSWRERGLTDAGSYFKTIDFESMVNAAKYPREPFERFELGFAGARDVGARSEVRILFRVLK